MLHIKTLLLKLVALATKNMLKQCKSWELFWSADSAPSLQPQCCSLQCRGRGRSGAGTHQRAGARLALGPVTGTMLALARKNLRIRRCGAVMLLLLLVIFLLHPGRFSVISVTSVPGEMVARARSRYCHTHATPSSSAAANLQLLHDLVAGTGAGTGAGCDKLFCNDHTTILYLHGQTGHRGTYYRCIDLSNIFCRYYKYFLAGWVCTAC